MAANKAVSMGSLLVMRSLKLRFRRVLVVFLALLVGASIITAMAGVYFDINQKMSYELRSYGANFFVGPGQSDYLKQSDYQQLLNLIPEGSGVASSPYLYGMARSDLQNIVLMGVDFSQLKKLVPYWQVQGSWIGVSFDDRHAMIGKKLADKLELKVGSVIHLNQGSERKALTIKGIIESGEDEDNYLIVNLPVVQQWLGREGKINYAMFSIDNSDGQVAQFSKQIKENLPTIIARPIRKVSASEGKVLEKIKLLMGVVAVVILILSTLCVNTTLTAMFAERRREFALQKALGAPNRAITRQILQETAIITIAASVGGLVLGYLLAQILGETVFSSSIELRLPVFFITIILSFLAALVAAIIPTLRAIHVNPAKVLKGE